MPSIVRLSLGMLLLCHPLVADATITASPRSIDFPDQQINTRSAPATITLRNGSDTPMSVLHYMNNSEFELDGGTCGPVPFEMPAQSECTLLFVFYPHTTGPFSDSAFFGLSDSTQLSLNFWGDGVNGNLDISPPFGLFWLSVAVGESSVKEVLLENVGDGRFDVPTITPASPPFAHVGGTCALAPFTLYPGQSCTVAYSFSPTAVGQFDGDISISTSLPGASADTVHLEGFGRQGNQDIHFPAQSDRVFRAEGGTPVDPPATVNSGLAVVYGSATPATCTVAGHAVATVGVGTCTLTADQPGNATWLAAAQQTQSFEISRAQQALTFAPQSSGTRGFLAGSSFAIDPLATSAAPNSGQPIVYSALDTSVCTVTGDVVTMVGLGTCHLAANQGGDANHDAAPQATAQVQLVSRTDADLRVDKTSDAVDAHVGDTITYTIVVDNAGPAAVLGASLLDLPPERLGDVAWACVDAIGAACPVSSNGDGGIDVVIDLPAGASVRFELVGTVRRSSMSHPEDAPMHNTASIHLPAGSPLTDPDTGNNASTASVLVISDVVHADGFEAP